MKITKKILQDIIEEEINAVMTESLNIQKVLKGISDARISLGKARGELYGTPGTDYAIKNMASVTEMLFVISDMLKGRYNKANAVKYGLKLPTPTQVPSTSSAYADQNPSMDDK